MDTETAEVTDLVSKQVKGGIVLLASASSPPSRVSGAILKNLQEGLNVSVRAIGAGSVNQAVKGCAIARQVYVNEGRELHVSPAFETVMVDGNERTAMVLAVSVQ